MWPCFQHIWITKVIIVFPNHVFPWTMITPREKIDVVWNICSTTERFIEKFSVLKSNHDNLFIFAPSVTYGCSFVAKLSWKKIFLWKIICVFYKIYIIYWKKCFYMEKKFYIETFFLLKKTFFTEKNINEKVIIKQCTHPHSSPPTPTLPKFFPTKNNAPPTPTHPK